MSDKPADNDAAAPGSLVNGPTITQVVVTPSSSGVLGTGSTVTIRLVPSEPVDVTPGPGDALPFLSLNDGGKAVYDPGASEAGYLVFTYTVAAGQTTNDLEVTGLVSQGATIGAAEMFGPEQSYSITPGSSVPPAPGEYSIATGDLNGDGHPDIIVGGGSVFVFDGDGHGGLLAPTPYAASNGISSVAVADLNGDGLPDVVTNGTLPDLDGGPTDYETVLLNDGTGGLLPAKGFPGAVGNQIALADLNGDGTPDLIALEYTGVSVAFGDGHGGFSAATFIPVGEFDREFAVADLNGDGRPDLLVSDVFGGVDVLLNNGQGGFAAAGTYAAEGGNLALAVGDLNGDGKPDLVIGKYSGGELLLGNGAGGFSAPVTLAWGLGVTAIQIADLNGDGRPDIVVADDQGDPGPSQRRQRRFLRTIHL